MKTFENVIPEYYHEFKENFDELPLKRLWDHAVELLPREHIVDCKMCNLILKEQKELDAFLCRRESEIGKNTTLKLSLHFIFLFDKRKMKNYNWFRIIGN